jgi:hypothetical protein
MTPLPLDTEPACPEATLPGRGGVASERSDERRFRVEERSFDDIPRPTWDALAESTKWATPFSSWAFQRAWWDAYGASAHEQTVVVVDDRDEITGIVPLMHRHQVEPSDAARTLPASRMRSPTTWPPNPRQTIRTRCRGMRSTFAGSAAATRPPMHSRRRSARVRCVSSGR